ncbi:hypothetical protein JCM11251_003088 [Rhodosporidiobolus azoricus]
MPSPLPEVTKFVQAPQAHSATLQTTVDRFLRQPEGRDAALRLFQYTLRLTIYLRRKALPSSLSVRLLAVVSTLAAFRRIVALTALLASFRSKLLPNTENRPYIQQNEGLTFSADSLLTLLRSTLDLLAVLTDNLYLFSRLRLVPLHPRTIRRVDKLSDVAALLSASIGLMQVVRRRRAVFIAGRGARRKALVAEKRLAELELELWEGTGAGVQRIVKVKGKEREKGSDEMAVEKEERGLRETVKRERRKMRNLHDVLSELRWERVKVVAEGLFAFYDALDLETAAEGVKAASGVVSAGIEFSQAWAEHIASRDGIRRLM